MLITEDELIVFMTESNRIDGRANSVPTFREVVEMTEFMESSPPTAQQLVNLMLCLRPEAHLRDRIDMPDMMVGNYVCPPSGPWIMHKLHEITSELFTSDPYQTYLDMDRLQPFHKANGIAARAVWLWQMAIKEGGVPLGFLQRFHFQALEDSQRAVSKQERPSAAVRNRRAKPEDDGPWSGDEPV